MPKADSCWWRHLLRSEIRVFFDQVCDSALSEHDAPFDSYDRQFPLLDHASDCVLGHVQQLGCISHRVELKVVREFHCDLQ